MVTLPSNMFTSVTLPATLWFFDKKKPQTEKKNEILFVDARNVFIAPHYINFCIDNEISEVKDDIIEFLFDSERNRFGINDGIEYLCKLFSHKDIEQYVLPRCEEDELLTSIAYHIPFNIQSELLEEKMLKKYYNSHNVKWLPLLIHRSNVEALEEYYQLACSSNQIPDMTEGSQVPYIADAFRSISNIRPAFPAEL